MDELMKELILSGCNARGIEFKDLLNKANVRDLKTGTICDALILPPHKQMEVYIILEYKLDYLMKNGTKYEIAHLNHVISNYLFLALTPLFGRELAIKYAEDACKFDSSNDVYSEWLETILDEKTIF